MCISYKMAGKIVICRERCKGCGLCVVVCPKKCITISKHSNRSGFFPVEFSGSECTGCAACGIICPDVVIEVYRDGAGAVEGGEQNKARLAEEKL